MEAWRVRVWIKPVRDAQRNVVQEGRWSLVGKVETTEEAIEAVIGIVKESGSVAKATRKAPKGEPVEVYGSHSSFSIKRYV